MAIELTFQVMARDAEAATEFSRQVASTLRYKLKGSGISITSHPLVEDTSHCGTHRARLSIRPASGPASAYDPELPLRIRSILGGVWNNDSDESSFICESPSSKFPGLTWMNLSIVIPPVPLPEKKPAKKNNASREESELEEISSIPSAETFAVRIGLGLISLIAMAISLAIFYPGFLVYRSINMPSAEFSLGFIFKLWISACVLAAVLGIVSFPFFLAVSSLQGAFLPRSAHQAKPNTLPGPCPTIFRGIIFFLALFSALDIFALVTWDRHLWQPSPTLSAKSTVADQSGDSLDVSTNIDAPPVDAYLAQNARITQGLRVIFPRFRGTHRFWIYVDRHLVGKFLVEGNNHLREQRVDNIITVYDSSGARFSLDASQELPLWYPEGTGLFGEALPTMVYEDGDFYSSFSLPYPPGSYEVEVLEAVDPQFAIFEHLTPFNLVHKQTVEVQEAFLASAYPGVTNSDFTRNAIPALAQQAGTEEERAAQHLNRARNAMAAMQSDPLIQAVRNFRSSGASKLTLNLPYEHHGPREYETEQVLHLARWVSEHYRRLVNQ